MRVLPHEQLDAVQRELRSMSGVTALIYDQEFEALLSATTA